MLEHFVIWGSSREGMSQSGSIANAALLDNGTVMLVTQGAIDRNNMPPGFVRYLTDEEKNQKEIVNIVDRGESYAEHIMRIGRKRNDIAVPVLKAKPYYRQFDKRKF